MYEWATETVAGYDLPVRVRLAVQSPSSAAELQLLEVVSALLSDPKAALDEPTTARSAMPTSSVCTTSSCGLARNGMGVVYVSHRLPEALDVAGSRHRPA